MKKIFLAIFTLVLGGIMATAPVMAEKCTCKDGSQGVETTVLGEDIGGGKKCKCDDGKGSAITDILVIVMDIMTIGIGILGVIGISIVGIQYLTAGGSEDKTRKAKRRMFEIVLGVVAYVVIYAALRWLIPNFSLPN